MPNLQGIPWSTKSYTCQLGLTKEWEIGLGNAEPESPIQATSGDPILGYIMLANMLQLFMSLTYISYNGLFTRIVISSKLIRYASKRSGLRVTCLLDRFQRSSYFLTFSYRFSVPLLILSGFIYWILSQAVFLTELTTILADGTMNKSNTQNYFGYSFIAIAMAFISGSIMILIPLLLGWFRYSLGAPLIESLSLAISAACHAPGQRPGESQQLLDIVY